MSNDTSLGAATAAADALSGRSTELLESISMTFLPPRSLTPDPGSSRTSASRLLPRAVILSLPERGLPEPRPAVRVQPMDHPAADRPHVMRVYSRLEVGGIEQQMLRVLPRLNAGRYRVSLCLLKRPGELAAELRARGVAVHVLPFKGRLAPTSLLALAK